METLPERLLRNFAGFGVPKPEAPNAMSVDVILTPEEAARGGTLSIDVPLSDECGVCAGTGSDWLFPCMYCGGGGTVSRMQHVQVPIPQSIRLGITREVTLEGRGINNVLLKLRIRVSSEQFY
jgi:DnaJ-class molecular chaperone